MDARTQEETLGLAFTRALDLSQPLYDGCPGNPAFASARVHTEMTHEQCGWDAERIDMATHVGTHMDAPAHRLKGGATIDTIPVSTFIGPATAVDLFGKLPGEGIVAEDLSPYERFLKPIVLLCTGWGARRAHSEEYLLRSPWLSGEAAQWLVDRRVRGVGIDHFSIGSADPDKVEAPHDILLGAGVWILEELLLPRELLGFTNLHLIALPLLLRGGSGAPARAIAVDLDTGTGAEG